MKRRAILLAWILLVVVAVIGIVVSVAPGSVVAMTDEVRRLLSGVDGNAMLARLIVPAKPALPAEGLRKLEAQDWTNHPEMPIPADEQADLGLILWRQQLNEMGRGGENRYAISPRTPVEALDLLAMSNESYRMMGMRPGTGRSSSMVTPVQAAPKAGRVKTHTQTREKGPLSPEQLKAIHASKRK